jgi:hypothetical protein
VKIIDTFEQMASFKAQIEQNPSGWLAYWHEYIDRCASELKEKVLQDSQGYALDEEIKPVLCQALTAEFHLLAEAHLHFEQVIAGISERFQLLFPQSRQVSVYFYIGLCNGAGWATKVGEEPVVLLGAEKIVELKWHSKADLESLICHELCHIAHSDLRKAHLVQDATANHSQAVWQLYQEGFAQRYQQLLAGKDGYYHQDRDHWLDWCEDNKSDLAGEYLSRILAGTSVQPFFGDWASYRGHADTGYYLGCEFIRSLETKYSLTEIACLEPYGVYAHAIDFLKKGIVQQLRESADDAPIKH